MEVPKTSKNHRIPQDSIVYDVIMTISRRPVEVHPRAAPGGIVDGRGGDSPPVRYGQCSRNIEIQMHVKSCLVEAVKFSFLMWKGGCLHGQHLCEFAFSFRGFKVGELVLLCLSNINYIISWISLISNYISWISLTLISIDVLWLSRMLLVDPCANCRAFGAWTLGSSAFGGTISTQKTTEANRKPWRIRVFVRGMISESLFGSGTEWNGRTIRIRCSWKLDAVRIRVRLQWLHLHVL